MTKEIEKDKNNELSEAKIYEVSYHLVPTMAEDNVPVEGDKIKAVITSLGGEIISEAAPELKNLAYEIEKYNKAYFSWVKFALIPEDINKVKIALDANDSIIRHLIVSTVKESTLLADKESKRPARATTDAVDQAEIDKTIDELVITS